MDRKVNAKSIVISVILILTGVVMLIALGVGILEEFKANDIDSYPHAIATSEGGKWRAGIMGRGGVGPISAEALLHEPVGEELLESFSAGVLIYEGNDEGRAENVSIVVKEDGKVIDTQENLSCYSREESNFQTKIDQDMINKPYFYWVIATDTIPISFNDVDKIEIDVSWSEGGAKKADTLTLDIKAARQRFISPL